MPHTKLSIKELRDLINQGEAADPLVFLESVMNGQDPRRLSGLYNLIMDIYEFSGDDISPVEFREIVDYVQERHKYHPVSVNESMSAAKTLAEYLHPKRKQVEINGGMGGLADPSQSPLTEEEIELFKEKFNDDF